MAKVMENEYQQNGNKKNFSKGKKNPADWQDLKNF
jgi:hypothetical protein